MSFTIAGFKNNKIPNPSCCSSASVQCERCSAESLILNSADPFLDEKVKEAIRKMIDERLKVHLAQQKRLEAAGDRGESQMGTNRRFITNRPTPLPSVEQAWDAVFNSHAQHLKEREQEAKERRTDNSRTLPSSHGGGLPSVEEAWEAAFATTTK